ncbi:Zn-ribbon domain-containing OB-fold protein [Haloarcula salinisoli]|uniref:OB-fold domain-containing protein n=1 Tax=Haloarcula salinisoli TaxID=2487746 RepID=A0A8J8CBA5_9EURY|nr:OB-fold domain-containing protein [Halomicroarcula salinisoli]MBX0288621.1 OB-fold domain-containing protein [Halomicroarcula salinisoli]MBX0305999.1 OB-fold domain-containing protein [Halomicroarcula salinisoli]
MSERETASRTHDEFCRAIETGDPFYLACPDGHGSVPPRRVCPECGAQSLTVEALPETGRVQAATVVHVATSAFADSAPYVTAIADFGPVSLTGVVAETDPEAVEHGTDVTLAIQRTDERKRPTLVFEPR